MSSLAQDELGHAAALYGLLGDLTGSDPDALAYDREPSEYRHCRLLDHGRGDWAMTIARRYLYDTADAVRLDGLAGGSWAPLDGLVAKLIREERYHRMHAGAWLDRLARSPGEPRDRLLAALARLAPDAATVFAPLPDEPALSRRGSRGAHGRAGGSLAGIDRADLATLRRCHAPAHREPERGR
jgi:ring-1,2-phenylacetyl-CoA epoxidase subunit PaaC